MQEINLDIWGQDYEEAKKERESGDFYKLVEGSQKLRILTNFVAVDTLNRAGKYMGIVTQNNKAQEGDTVNYKGWAWAIIRETGDLKIVQLSKTILHQIYSLKKDTEYAFDNCPMPYDITINAIGAGTKEVKYSVTPARQNTDVTGEEMEKLNKKRKIADIVNAMIAKQEGTKMPSTPVDYPTASGEPAF